MPIRLEGALETIRRTPIGEVRGWTTERMQRFWYPLHEQYMAGNLPRMTERKYWEMTHRLRRTGEERYLATIVENPAMRAAARTTTAVEAAALNPANVTLPPGQRGITEYPEELYKWWGRQVPDPKTGEMASSLLEARFSRDPATQEARYLPADIRRYLIAQEREFAREFGPGRSPQFSRWLERFRQQRQTFWEEISPETFYEGPEGVLGRAGIDPADVEYMAGRRGRRADLIRRRVARDISRFEIEKAYTKGAGRYFWMQKGPIELSEGDWYLGRPSRLGAKVWQPKYLSLEYIKEATQQNMYLRRMTKTGRIGAAVPMGAVPITGLMREAPLAVGGPWGRMMQASPRAVTNRLFHLWSAAGNDITSNIPQIFTEYLDDKALNASLDKMGEMYHIPKGMNLRTGFEHTTVEKKLERLLLDITGTSNIDDLERIAAESAVAKRGPAWRLSGRFTYRGPIREEAIRNFQESIRQVVGAFPEEGMPPIRGYKEQLKFVQQFPTGTTFRGRRLPGGGYEMLRSMELTDPKYATMVLNPRSYLERIKQERAARITALGGELREHLSEAERAMARIRGRASRSVLYGDVMAAYTPNIQTALAPEFVEVGMVRMPFYDVRAGRMHRYHTELFTAAGEGMGVLPAEFERKFEKALARRTGAYGWMEKETAKGLLKQRAWVQVHPEWMKWKGRWRMGYKANLFLDLPRLEERAGQMVVVRPQPVTEVVGLFKRKGLQQRLKDIYMGRGATIVGEEASLKQVLGKRFPVTTFEQMGFATAGTEEVLTKGMRKFGRHASWWQRFDLRKVRPKRLGAIAIAAAGALLLYQATKVRSRRLVTPERISDSLYGDTPNRDTSEQMPFYSPQARVTMQNMTPPVSWDNRVNIDMGDRNNTIEYGDIMKALQTTSRAALDITDANVTYNVMDDSTKMNRYALQRKVAEYFNR